MISVYLLLDCVAETCFREMVQRGSPKKNFKKIFPDNQKVAIYFRKKLATSVTFSDFIRLIYRTQ